MDVSKKMIALRSLPARMGVHRALIIDTTLSLDDKEAQAHKHGMISHEIELGGYEDHTADRRFMRLPIGVIRRDPELCPELEILWTQLNTGFYGRVWFCGDTTSEFTRAVAWVAVSHKLHIRNMAEPGSLLYRFLRQWII